MDNNENKNDNTQETVNGVPMGEIIDPLSTAVESISNPGGGEAPAPQEPEKKKFPVMLVIVLVIVIIGVVLLVLKPWESKVPGIDPTSRLLGNDTTTTEPQVDDYDSAEEGYIDKELAEKEMEKYELDKGSFASEPPTPPEPNEQPEPESGE